MVLESNSRKQLTQIRAEEWMVPGGSHLGKDLSLRIYGEWGMEKGCFVMLTAMVRARQGSLGTPGLILSILIAILISCDWWRFTWFLLKSIEYHDQLIVEI